MVVLGLGCGVLLTILYLIDPGAGEGFLPCLVHALTGLYCPGCGMARAAHSLLHLEVYQAFRFNPLGVMLLPLIAAYLIARVADYAITGSNHIDRHLSPRILWWVLAIVLLYGAARNLPFPPFSLLAPTVVP